MANLILPDTDWSEHYIKRGDPSKPTYYIIRRNETAEGLFFRYIVNAGRIRYALSKGWLPVVDMLTEWRMLRKLGLLKVKPALMEEISALRQNLFAPNDRVLGVLLRGTDYLTERPKWHPIPPPLEFAASIVLEKLREWHCNKIFLATEDKSIVQAFKNIFGKIFITYEREYVDFNPQERVCVQQIDRPNDNFLQGKDYLTQMALLSTCNSFVAARCSGSVGVMLMADKFEHTYFFNLGRFGALGLE